MARVALVFLCLLVACRPADPPARLTIRPSPAVIDGRGETSALSIQAFLESGAPGSGLVTLSTAGRGEVEPTSVTLDSSGAATATYSCTVATEPGCAGAQPIVATWARFERRVAVFVASGDGGPRVGDVDAGSPYDDAGCVRTPQPFGVREECLTADGGACIVDAFFDGGRTAPSCAGLEGDTCWSDRACRVGFCDDMGRCSFWVCRTKSGPCGDGGTCVDLGPFVAPACSTFAAGSPCDTAAQCLDGGICKSYSAAGTRTCSYGRLGQGCAVQADCREGTCVVAACR